MVTAILAATVAVADPNKEQYELQERCGRAAALAFKTDNPDGTISNTDEGQSIASYQNHYNAKLNKCFVLYTTTMLNYKATPKYTATSMTLFDVNENKEYGTWFGRADRDGAIICNFQDNHCHSEKEWKELIKPYMSD